MLGLPDYTVTEKIYQGDKTVVYRGYREEDTLPVIIKTLLSPYPEPKKIAQFHHEYEITKDLNLTGIIKPYELRKYKNTWALILEDIHGSSLKNLLAVQQLDLVTFLQIALILAETLSELHRHNIIHKDIKPANIIVNLHTHQVRLTDFSISSKLSLETPAINQPNLLEGTLTYMSPEQTGRMNRPLDYRTDFYSLGIVFYEMLVGHPPFQSVNAIELVHAHLAKHPLPPHKVNRQLPRAISHIIMKLIAKSPETRYQNARGLKADLLTCWHQLQTTGKIEEFICGQQDRSDKFQLSPKIYGRDNELGKLLQTFERVKHGATELLLVTGPAGIGKSALIQQIYKPLVQRYGYFVAGKFDHSQRHLPYHAIIQASRDLLTQILTESEERIHYWQELLNNTLGDSLPLLLEVLPELEILLGVPPAATWSSLLEIQYRFNLALQQFIQTFAQPDHPLVIFLDDMQWADATSLKLIESLLTETIRAPLFIIGAYQDEEVTATHPLTHTLLKIQESQSYPTQIRLSPLSLISINQLIIDTIHAETTDSLALANLILRKTDGNPFFVTEFLKTLYHNQLLRFDTQQLTWVWDLEQIQQCIITDNVVDLLINQLQEFPEVTRLVLTRAACIGIEFDLLTLATISNYSPFATAQALISTLESNVCLPLGDGYRYTLVEEFFTVLTQQSETEKQLFLSKCRYRFSHSRIQQAAYSLLSATEQQVIHYRLGNLLLETYSTADSVEERLFEIANHLNQGVSLVQFFLEKVQLASLNLRAGRKAKMTMAYATATKYLNTGLSLLNENSWREYYALTLALTVELLEIAYFNRNLTTAAPLADTALQHAQSVLDTVKIYELKINFYVAQTQLLTAIDLALEILTKLEVTWCKIPPTFSLEELSQLPPLNYPVATAALRIFVAIAPAIYIAKPEIFATLVFTMLKLSLTYGNAPESAVAYACYGLILCGTSNDIERGYQLGQLALVLVEQFKANSLKPKIYEIVNAHIQLWKKHVKTTLAPLQDTIELSRNQGDFEFAGYTTIAYTIHLFFIGEPLTVVAKQYHKYLELMTSLKQSLAPPFINIWQQLVANLMSVEVINSPARLTGEYLDETQILPWLVETNNHSSRFAFHLVKCMLNYWFNDFEAAIAQAQLARPYEMAITGLLLIAELNFYESLARLAHAQSLATGDTTALIEPVTRYNQPQMQHWASQAPMNYQHKYYLVEAELARLQGHVTEAMSLYEQAIEGAQKEGYLQEMALANERAAEFYLALGQTKIAKMYLTEAHSAYLTWGAHAKVKELRQRYSFLAVSTTAYDAHLPQHSLMATVTATTLTMDNPLDFTTMIKVNQAISSEIVLDQLIQQLMHIVLENLGAEEGWLLLTKTTSSPTASTPNPSLTPLFLEAYATTEQVQLLNSLPLDSTTLHEHTLSNSIVKYVARTQSPLVIHNASHNHLFSNDPYIIQKQPKSVLCTPIINKNQLIGIIYLENNLTAGAFTQDRLTILKLLSTQMAISLENARFYAQLEQARLTAEQARVAAEQARQTAETASRAKSTFLAKMSHELRTPLNAILGYSDLLQEEAEEAHYNSILPDLERIQIAGHNLLGIISDILDISKIEADKLDLNLSEFVVTELIEEVVTTIQPLLSLENNRLIVQPANNLGTCQADRQKVAQILLNLLNNATKFTHQGTITFTCYRQTIAATHSDWLFFQIVDTGIGIPQAQMSDIFEAFCQADNSSTRRYEGAGLGLTISEHFARALGGNISLTSEPGQGSIFTVQLPAKVKL